MGQFKSKKKLPNKPSALIRLAINDLNAIEKQKDKYSINMTEWHSPNYMEDTCAVCLAGSVMANTLKLDSNEHLDADEVEDISIQNKLYAINSFRIGQIKEGVEQLNLKMPLYLNNEVPIVSYASNKSTFKKQLLKMADVLEGYKL